MMMMIKKNGQKIVHLYGTQRSAQQKYRQSALIANEMPDMSRKKSSYKQATGTLSKAMAPGS